MSSESFNPVTEPLDQVAALCLLVGRMLMEFGGTARRVQEGIRHVAEGYGCTSVESFCQHAAIMVTLRRDGETCMQMGKVGEHGVNLRRSRELQMIIGRIKNGEMNCAEAKAVVSAVPKITCAYPIWIVCLATALACCGFGRLLGVDWIAFLPILAGTFVAQWARHEMLVHRKQNIFITWGTIAFIAATISGYSSLFLGSQTVLLAMIASTLLCVPGIAILNAQVDVLDARPNLAAARALRITYMLLFMTFGIVLAQLLVGTKLVPLNPPPASVMRVLHQALFGGIAAVGFGILFNCPRGMLGICFGAGAMALTVRTISTDYYDFSLATGTFFAALLLAIVDRLWQQPHTLRGCVLAVVGVIPMVPGSLAAKVLMSFFSLMHAKPAEAAVLAPQVLENFLLLSFTLASMGIGLAIPSLIFPLPADD